MSAVIEATGELTSVRRTDRIRNVVLALARVETRRFMKHPLFLAAAAFTAFSLWGGSMENDSVAWTDEGSAFYNVLVGNGFFLLHGAVFIVANLAALRARRHGLDEEYKAAPSPASARTGACLFSLVCPVVVTSFILAGMVALKGGADGMSVNGTPWSPDALDLAQAPLITLVAGALGILSARWIPSVVAGFLIGLVLWVSPFTWIHPWGAMDAAIVDAEDWGYAAPAMGWHIVYLAGLVAVGASGALLRTKRSTALFRITAVATAVSIAAFLVQK